MRTIASSIAFTALLAVTAAAPAHADPSGACIPAFAYGAFGKTSLSYGGNAGCDDWNSSLGNYANPGNDTGGCDLGTNGTSSGALDLHGTAAQTGAVYYGPGGSSSTLKQSGQPGYTSSGALTNALSLPSVTLPSLGSNLGACNGCTPVPNNTYTTVSGSVTFPAGAYVIGSLTADVTVTSGSVTIYVGTVGSTTGNFAPNSVTNTTGGTSPAWGPPANLVFMVNSTVSAITLTGDSGYFALYAPDSDITNHGNGDIYGAIIGKSYTSSGTMDIHYDVALASVQVGTMTCGYTEVSRSSPVAAALPNSNSYIVQGTFEAPTGTATLLTSSALTGVGSLAAFSFPYLKGHLRARLESSVTTTGTGFAAGTIYFDTGALGVGMIPPVNASGCTAKNGTCRNIFTTTTAPNATSGVAFHPSTVQVNTANASTIAPLITAGITPAITLTGAQQSTLMTTILNARLGGVDRSTVAVIQASTYAGSTTRPTMIYFGAADGMLHAACAQTGGTTASQTTVCPNVGTELWAFLPRVQLPAIAKNTAKIDGSARVLDVYGDFTNATPTSSTKVWKTVLVFQTGYSGNATSGATYALDVTDPASPTVLWEYATPTTSVGVTDLGTGLTVASGPAQVSGANRNLTVLETNNGGSGSAAVVVQGVYTESGSKLWTTPFAYTYSTNTSRYSALNEAALKSGIPGGAVGVDMTGTGYFTDFMLGDIFGDMWRLNVNDGTSRNGTNTPLFSFTTNYHPFGAAPAIYAATAAANSQVAVIASGGYADPTAAGFTTANQYIIGAKINSTSSTISETTAACSTCALTINTALTAQGAGFAQALIVGTQLFVTTDTSDVNSVTYQTASGGSTASGRVFAIDLTGSTATTTTTVQSGAGAVVNDGTKMFTGGGNKQQQLTAQNGSTGTTVDLKVVGKLTRLLYLRTM